MGRICGLAGIDMPTRPKGLPVDIGRSLDELEATFAFDEFIEKGANGYVVLARNRITKSEVAIKYYFWDTARQHTEPQRLASVRSDYILPIQHAALVSSDWALFQTPRCPYGDLDAAILAGISTRQALTWAGQVVAGVATLHGSDLLHRDLKPANAFLDRKRNAVIADFGSVAAIPSGSTAITASGHSILYRPPESVKTESYTRAGDIYQCGILLYQLLGGYLPYQESDWLTLDENAQLKRLTERADQSLFVDECIKKRILAGTLLRMDSLPAYVPSAAVRLVRRATRVDPGRRIQTASELAVGLHEVRASSPDWRLTADGAAGVNNGKELRLVGTPTDGYIVEVKRRGTWKNIRAFGRAPLRKQLEMLFPAR